LLCTGTRLTTGYRYTTLADVTQILAPTRRGTSSTAMRIALPQAKFNTNAVHNAGSYIKPR
ncbi:hypothetical protein NAL12_11825, partial [Corynebacterium belfantii]|uniref:hypothetical protein n=1 Tax=Corynebacterium belfantii TaxID=2014537 RepID=UPI00397749A4